MNEEEIAEIVTAARRRGLGARPGLRRVASVLWSAFLGATNMILVLSLAPESWGLPHLSEGRVTVVFGVAWLLCLIPALAASILSSPPPHGVDHAR